MGIYLGQLPPAEIARLKAELAETIIANFCYPRFFDYRTNSLRMRPVDRSKRQEVWLYLSSVDFTAWNRVDLMSPDLQRYIERLFIQFVQRNRNFFGQQGRKRMPDVRTLIATSSSTVVQSLRNHVAGQRQERQLAFGSPRPVNSWSTVNGAGRAELNWEQVSAMTLLLQHQLQELRGEAKSPQLEGRLSDLHPSQPVEPAERATKRNGRSPIQRTEQTIRQPSKSVNTPGTPLESGQGMKSTILSNPGSSPIPTFPQQASQVAPTPAADATSSNGATKKEVLPPPGTPHTETSFAAQTTLVTPSVTSVSTTSEAEQAKMPVVAKAGNGTSVSSQVLPPALLSPTIANTPTQPVPPIQPQSMHSQSVQTRVQSVSPASTIAAIPSLSEGVVELRDGRDLHMMLVGDEDIAIFEQLRHQMILWLRVEAVHAGIEMNGQTPSQLLDLLRRQERFDETRLQVVSTLLNLANQVMKNKRVSVLDYKQALMFHLMHTRR